MNFTLQTQPDSPAPPGPATPTLELPELQPPDQRRRRRGKAPLIMALLVVVGAGGVVATVPGAGDTVKGWFGPSGPQIITAPVTLGKLSVIVKERGALESAKNLEVKNEVEGQTTILKILPEGTRVKKGDLVCELDSSTLRDNLNNQIIAVEKATADYLNAQKTHEVAKISVTEYVEGTYLQELQTAQGEQKLAEADLQRAKDRLDWSNRMLKYGYVSKSQNIADELSLKKADFSKIQAEKKIEVLKKYTKEKQKTELEANVKKAEADMLAKKSTLELEKQKAEKLRNQIEKCRLYAPGDGLIVYANDNNNFRGNNQVMIEEGAQVRERQTIFTLPDIANMQVNAKIHESMINKVAAGLPARVRVEAAASRLLSGRIKNVQPLPDPSSFFSSDVKVYTALITIEDGPDTLRPGMSAEVEVLVTQKDDVLSVPVQAILEFKGKDHVMVVRSNGTTEQRDIKLGITNDKVVEILEGLKEGERVALNPLSLMSEEEKRAAFGDVKGEIKAKDWTKADVEASTKAGDAAAKGGAAKKGRGGPGGGAAKAAFGKVRSNLAPEEQAKLFNPSTSEDEKVELWKKAGLTDEEIEMIKNLRPGGGGPGGGGGGGFGGGPGGGGGGGAQ